MANLLKYLIHLLALNHTYFDLNSLIFFSPYFRLSTNFYQVTVCCLQDSEFLYVARQLGPLLENLSPLTRACHIVALGDAFDMLSTTLVRI